MTLQKYQSLSPEELAKTISVHYGEDLDSESFKALVENSKPIATTHNGVMSTMVCEEGIYIAYGKQPETFSEQRAFKRGLSGLLWQLYRGFSAPVIGKITLKDGYEEYTDQTIEPVRGEYLEEMDRTIEQITEALVWYLAQSPLSSGGQIPKEYALFGEGEQSGGVGD